MRPRLLGWVEWRFGGVRCRGIGTGDREVAVAAFTRGACMSSIVSTDMESLALFGGDKLSEAGVRPISVNLDESDIEKAVEVMRGGMLAQGKNVVAFEERFAQMTDAKHAIACSNGTTALQLAYLALLERGDTVLCPAWTYVATASMLAAMDCEIVWVEADQENYTVDVNDLEKKLERGGVKAIAATHIYGSPVDAERIDAIAAKHNVPVVYDCAQAHLATLNGKGMGAFGDAVTYSFYATKNMTTGGEGGMVTTNSDELNEKIRLLRSHGEVAKYTHAMVGYNYRMSDVDGAIGLNQLDRLQGQTDRRREIAKMYEAGIAEIHGITAPGFVAGSEPAIHLYPIRLDVDAFKSPQECGRDEDRIRDVFQQAMIAEGVGCAVHYPKSLTRQPMFEVEGVEHQPICDHLSACLLCVPCHQDLTDAEVQTVLDAISKVAGVLRK